MIIWPWSQFRELRREAHAARCSASATQKKCNRLTARVKTLDAACSKHKGQARRDQAYIDVLEQQLPEKVLVRLRKTL